MKKSDVFVVMWWILILLFDQYTKYWFYDLGNGADWWWITKALNTGISRSLPLHGDITLIVSFLALGAFVWMIIKKELSLSIGVILIAGTLGNMIDRIRWWGVRDFIHIGNFPIFNIADIALTISVGWYILKELKILKR